MNLSRFLSESYDNVRENGVAGLRQPAQKVYKKGVQQGDRFVDDGENVYDFDWDLLVVVDACRLDLFRELGHEYDYVTDVESIWSVDSVTRFWMRKTFPHRPETEETTYVCGNPFSDSELDHSTFADVVEVWEHDWTDPGTVPPRAVTDATIRAMRDGAAEDGRVIAHYMQPHCPFIPRPDLSKGKDLERFGNQGHKDVWQRLRAGEVSREAVWEGYRENLRLALDDIELLLDSVDAERVVITSDHGNSLGELGIYGHWPMMPMASQREVPWVETTASDTGEYEVEAERERVDDVDRQEKLEALGYI